MYKQTNPWNWSLQGTTIKICEKLNVKLNLDALPKYVGKQVENFTTSKNNWTQILLTFMHNKTISKNEKPYW